MLNSSNMTHEEFYRVNGSMSPARIDAMLEEVDELRATNISEFVSYVKEARGCYPAEDFMQEHVSDLKDLAKRLIGDNRNSLLMLIERLEETVEEAVGNAEYGVSELDKILY